MWFPYWRWHWYCSECFSIIPHAGLLSSSPKLTRLDFSIRWALHLLALTIAPPFPKCFLLGNRCSFSELSLGSSRILQCKSRLLSFLAHTNFSIVPNLLIIIRFSCAVPLFSNCTPRGCFVPCLPLARFLVFSWRCPVVQWHQLDPWTNWHLSTSLWCCFWIRCASCVRVRTRCLLAPYERDMKP